MYIPKEGNNFDNLPPKEKKDTDAYKKPPVTPKAPLEPAGPFNLADDIETTGLKEMKKGHFTLAIHK